MFVLFKALLSLVMFNSTCFFLPFSVVGKRLEKAMGIVTKEVKAMSQADILAFEKSGEITFFWALFEIN